MIDDCLPRKNGVFVVMTRDERRCGLTLSSILCLLSPVSGLLTSTFNIYHFTFYIPYPLLYRLNIIL